MLSFNKSNKIKITKNQKNIFREANILGCYTKLLNNYYLLMLLHNDDFRLTLIRWFLFKPEVLLFSLLERTCRCKVLTGNESLLCLLQEGKLFDSRKRQP